MRNWSPTPCFSQIRCSAIQVPGRVGDLVVPVVLRGPARHRALLDAVGELALLRVLQQRDELALEVDQVLVHRVLLVAPHEPAHRVHPEQHRRVHRALHEVVLLAADARVLVQHVVEVADVRDPDAEGLLRRLHALRAVLVEGLAQVERVRDRVEHRLRGDVGLRRVQRRRELDVVGAQLAGERDPLLDREVGVLVALLARRQLLQRGCQHADLHELRVECGDGHGVLQSLVASGHEGFDLL